MTSGFITERYFVVSFVYETKKGNQGYGGRTVVTDGKHFNRFKFKEDEMSNNSKIKNIVITWFTELSKDDYENYMKGSDNET